MSSGGQFCVSPDRDRHAHTVPAPYACGRIPARCDVGTESRGGGRAQREGSHNVIHDPPGCDSGPARRDSRCRRCHSGFRKGDSESRECVARSREAADPPTRSAGAPGPMLEAVIRVPRSGLVRVRLVEIGGRSHFAELPVAVDSGELRFGRAARKRVDVSEANIVGPAKEEPADAVGASSVRLS